ncbi:protein phosphatase 1 regulatory subunit 42-like isoform X2 [Watersipora subatra]|uniref:protein phosphatase 1 regulatory subunit 42-like isoform X2 n=1 Tax=Watersipora subatra TaxID=2589382 RepID=UPI00355B7097
MVKLSIDLIARGTSGYTKKKRDEDMDQYLKRLTHLYLEGRCIDEVGEDLTLCRNLSVLYLYDNKVERVPDLSQNYCLTHLYLQNNVISEMNNLNCLKKLKKLYLGGNSITVVEGIDKLELLEELHVENQRLPPGEKLLFDPRSLNAISTSIRVLNVSGNNLDSVKEFSVIRDLHQFIASDNNLGNLKELASVLSQWRRLVRLDLEGNPFCLKSKYRDRVIVMSNSLDILDGKEISPTSRKFLQNWNASKAAQKKKKEELVLNNPGDIEQTGSNGLGSADLAGRSNLNKISSYVMPGLPRRQFEEVLAKSSANLPTSYTAPAVKHYGSQPNFVSSPSRQQKTCIIDFDPLRHYK